MRFARSLRWVGILVLLCTAGTSHAKEWYSDWIMEDRVASSQLILVARVSNVSSVSIVHGGKATTTIREYRFQPVQRLKGVFGRDELAMTSDDLGIPAGDGSTPSPLQQGDLCLLMLARTAHGFACVSGPSASVRQQVPRLSGPDDPIIAMTETLIKVSELPSRQARVVELANSLQQITGPAAIPLLESLRRRAIWAVQSPDVVQPVVTLASHESLAVRNAALQTIESILAASYLRQDDIIGRYAESLAETSQQPPADTAARTASLRAIGYLRDYGREQDWPARALSERLSSATTYAEKNAAIAALEQLGAEQAAAQILQAISELPLDENDDRERLYFSSAAALDRTELLPVLITRLNNSIAADQSPHSEIVQLAELASPESVTALLEAAGMRATAVISAPEAKAQTTFEDLDPWYEDATSLKVKIELAQAFERIKDPRAAGLLSIWLRHGSLSLRERAFAALEAINTEPAVTAARLRLKAEPHLPLKMQIARFLGKHGIQDGYPFAIEHISDNGLTQLAAEALAAIGDERAKKELWMILDTSHDPAWNGAALVGLAALGDERIKPRLLEILANPRDPLVPMASVAAGYAKDHDALPLLAKLVGSRNTLVASYAMDAINRFVVREGDEAGEGGNDVLRETNTALLALLEDPFADQALRIRALLILRDTQDDRLPALLQRLADQVELERSHLLGHVEDVVRKNKISFQ